jgi:hypothetical protein
MTFLVGDGDYWMGVAGLAKGLRKADSAYLLVVAVQSDMPESHRSILVSKAASPARSTNCKRMDHGRTVEAYPHRDPWNRPPPRQSLGSSHAADARLRS